MKTVLSQEQLAVGCKAGNRRLQELTYQTYAAKMMGVCRQYTPSVTLAEDILQAGFIKVFTRIHQYKGIGSFEGWIRRIVINTAIEICNREKKHEGHTYIANSWMIHPAVSNVTEKINADHLLASLNLLEPGLRLPFVLHGIEGYALREVATRLNITEQAAKTRVFRARQSLKKTLNITYSSKMAAKAS